MHEYERNILQQHIARLETKISKRTIINFVWLMLLSNLLFWLLIAHVGLKRQLNEMSKPYEAKNCFRQPLGKSKTEQGL